MGCNCKDNRESIKQGLKYFEELKQLFIKRMTEDSETQDRRRKDFNQAIFHYEHDEDVDSYNKYLEEHGVLDYASKKVKGETYQVWDELTMDDVLQCFDQAVKDWRKSWCDSDGCTRK